MRKLKLVKIDNFFFAYQKLPFKWFQIEIVSHKISINNDWAILDEVKIMVQITKLRFHFIYNINAVGTK